MNSIIFCFDMNKKNSLFLLVLFIFANGIPNICLSQKIKSNNHQLLSCDSLFKIALLCNDSFNYNKSNLLLWQYVNKECDTFGKYSNTRINIAYNILIDNYTRYDNIDSIEIVEKKIIEFPYKPKCDTITENINFFELALNLFYNQSFIESSSELNTKNSSFDFTGGGFSVGLHRSFVFKDRSLMKFRFTGGINFGYSGINETVKYYNGDQVNVHSSRFFLDVPIGVYYSKNIKPICNKTLIEINNKPTWIGYLGFYAKSRSAVYSFNNFSGIPNIPSLNNRLMNNTNNLQLYWQVGVGYSLNFNTRTLLRYSRSITNIENEVDNFFDLVLVLNIE